MHPSVELASGRATLGDIASIVADEPMRTALAGCEVQRLPGLAPYRIEPAAVLAAIAGLVDPTTVTVSGVCTVQRQVRCISETELAEAASAAVRGDATDPGLRITVVRTSGALRVPADTQAHLAATALVQARIGEVPYRVQVLNGNRELARGLVVLLVGRSGPVVQAARPIARGQAIDLADLTVVERELTAADREAMTDPAPLLGQVATRAIDAGAVITSSALRLPWLVRSGAQIELLYCGDGFELRAAGEALANGAVGQVIRVRRSGGEIISARVVSDGVLQIDF